MADKEPRFSPLVLAGDALLLLCALLGLAGSFLTLYGDPDALLYGAAALDRCAVNGDLFFLCAALFALLSLAAWSLPRFRAAAGTLTALWAGAMLLYWPELVQGAGIAVRDISILFSRRVDWGRVFQYDPGLTLLEEYASLRLFLLLVLAGLALLLGWAVVRARRWWVVLLLTLPPLLPGLLADLYPSWPAFMALAACWCAMLVTGLCKWAAPTGRGKLTLVVLPAVAAVLAVITLAFPREGYTRPPWALKAQEGLMNLTSRASEFFSRWDGPFRGPVTYVGAAEEADLAHAGPLDYFGRTVLRVKSDYDGRLYLRGSSLAVYEGGVWKALPEGTYEKWAENHSVTPISPLLLPALALERVGETHTATVDNVGAVGACVYIPYFPTSQDFVEGGMLPVEDVYVARKQGQWTHTVEFAELDVSIHERTAYQDYVYQHYLDVPEELRGRLDEIRRMIGSPYYTGGSVYAAEVVAEYLDTLCEYDTNVPAAPEGADPVDYFLNESRRGYCMHFASAAALLLRTMDIPARYVSGFAAESVPDKQVDVPDRAAHAWVEVWVDGFGWYPVEVTPSAAFDYIGQGSGDDPAQSSQGPSAPPEESGPPEPADDPAPSQGLPGGEGDGPGGAHPGAMPIWAGILLGAAGAAAALWLVQLAAKRLRARRMAGPDANRAALACYRYLCRLERWGGRMDDRAVELAEKARFSQHTLTQDELDLLRGLVDRERTRLCVASGLPKRLVFRYLWGMPKPPVPLTEEPPQGNGG